jgi:hypothetical protein
MLKDAATECICSWLLLAGERLSCCTGGGRGCLSSAHSRGYSSSTPWQAAACWALACGRSGHRGCTWTPGQCRAWRRGCQHLQSEIANCKDDPTCCIERDWLAYVWTAADIMGSTAAVAAVQGCMCMMAVVQKVKQQRTSTKLQHTLRDKMQRQHILLLLGLLAPALLATIAVITRCAHLRSCASCSPSCLSCSPACWPGTLWSQSHQLQPVQQTRAKQEQHCS